MTSRQLLSIFQSILFFGLLSNSFVSNASPLERVKIISEAHCMFGDGDLLVRDLIYLVKDKSTSRLVLEIRGGGSKKVFFQKELLNLKDAGYYAGHNAEAPHVIEEFQKMDLASDPSIRSVYRLINGLGHRDVLADVFLGDGLLIKLPNLNSGVYSLEVCTLNEKSKSCSEQPAVSFEEMFRSYSEETDKIKSSTTRLYYATKFKIQDGDVLLAKLDSRSVTIDNLPVIFKRPDLIINLPYFDWLKCSGSKS
jgi:hypothetical protein